MPRPVPDGASAVPGLPVDWDAEFEQGLDRLLGVVERAAAGPG